ncbi:hypothetical protein JMJ77_0008936, partial [Colletotrichum scovillei]
TRRPTAAPKGRCCWYRGTLLSITSSDIIPWPFGPCFIDIEYTPTR